jgi:predicted nucleic acid-binding Zn ribbon protein
LSTGPFLSLQYRTWKLMMEVLACTACGANLPEGSQFCLKCGKPIGSGASTAIQLPKEVVPVVVSARTLPREPVPLPSPRKRRRSRPRLVWLVVLLMLMGIWWVASSDNPRAQQLQMLFTTAETETVLPASFAVNARSFSSYRFTVPPSASSVVLTGSFKATGGSPSEVEVIVLADAAFATWQSGYATNTYYSSGRVAQGEINAALPSEPGTYYVVFNNKFSARTGKMVQTDVTLHYNRLLPEWLVKLKEQFWSPLGVFVLTGNARQAQSLAPSCQPR